MLARVRGWFDGAGWFVGLAIALFAFALLAVLLELQSPDLLLWTGHGTFLGRRLLTVTTVPLRCA